MNKLLMILALTMPFAAFADEKTAAYKLGDEVHAWTDLQKSGAASNPTAQPMPGEIADKVYDRYLKTFDYPIPATFDRESFVGGSGGSGGQ
ncbi:MAG: DUF3613 domain-containing protein [Pseudomonadota bacterium]